MKFKACRTYLTYVVRARKGRPNNGVVNQALITRPLYNDVAQKKIYTMTLRFSDRILFSIVHTTPPGFKYYLL